MTVVHETNSVHTGETVQNRTFWSSPKRRDVPGTQKSLWPFFGLADQYIVPLQLPNFSGTKVHSFGGDILVIRTRGLAGSNYKDKRTQTAADLHLRKIGQVCIISQNDAVLYGKVREIQHLLQIMPLPDFVPRGKFEISTWGLGIIMTREKFQNGNNQAKSVTIAGDEFVQISKSPESVSATWSSDLSLTEAISNLSSICGKPKNEGKGYLSIVEDGESYHGEILMNELMPYLDENPQNVKFVRLALVGANFSWRSSRKRFITSKVSHSEIGLKFYDLSYRSELIDALSLSGTDEVRSKTGNIAKLLEM